MVLILKMSLRKTQSFSVVTKQVPPPKEIENQPGYLHLGILTLTVCGTFSCIKKYKK